MTDIILFNSLPNYPVPSLTAGAYRIASVLRQQNYSTKVIDHFLWYLQNNPRELFNIIEKISKNKTPKLIGISTTWLSTILALGIEYKMFDIFLKKLREIFPSSLIVFGGSSDASINIYKLFRNRIDYWIEGLGESAIIELMKNGTKKFNFSDDKKHIKFDPIGSNFDFHNSVSLFDKNDIVLNGETLPLEISRGCRFKCKFCAYPLLGRSPSDTSYIRCSESLAQEFIENYKNFKTKNYFMLCDTFNETTNKLINIRKALDIAGIDKINFSAYIRADLLNAHPQQIEILKDIGIKSVFFGIESLNDVSAKSIGKGLGAKKTIEIIEKSKKIWGDNTFIHGSFIIGLPHETPDTLYKWASPILNGNSVFDSFKFIHLIFYKSGPIHQSEFSKNPKKYGYTLKIDESGSKYKWTNDIWDSNICENIQREYEKIAIEKNTNGVNSWVVMSLKTLGWSDNEIKKLRHHELGTNKKLKKDKLMYLEKYLKEVAKSL